MTFVKQIGCAAALGVAMLIGYGPMAQAAYTVTLAQMGSNVVATGSGSIDLAGLMFDGGPSLESALIDPSIAEIFTGPAPPTYVSEDFYVGGITGPTNFGSGIVPVQPNSGSGDLVGIEGAFDTPFASGLQLRQSPFGHFDL